MLLLLRTDWLRKNQIIWHQATPWILKECAVCSKVNHAENDRKFYVKAIAVPRNIEPSICCTVELGFSLAIGVQNPPASRWLGQTMGFLVYIRPYLVMRTERHANVNEKRLLTWTANSKSRTRSKTKIYITCSVGQPHWELRCKYVLNYVSF